MLEILDGTSNTLFLGERMVGDAALDSWLHSPITPGPDPPIHGTSAYACLGAAAGPERGRGVARGHRDDRLQARHSTGSRRRHRCRASRRSHPTPVPWSELSSHWWARMSAYGSYHIAGANVALADGSVRFMRDSTSLATLADAEHPRGRRSLAGRLVGITRA